MAKPYTTAARTQMVATSATELPLMLVEINHDDLAAPVRVVDDTDNITHNGNLYVAMRFSVKPPDDLSQGAPRASLAVDNVGRELMPWLELSGGGRGATATLRQVMRSTPNTVEWEITMDLSNLVANAATVVGTLGFDDLLNLPALPVRYTLENAPGLY